MNFEDVKKIIVDTLGCDEDKVTEEASLTEDLEADSLDAVEIILGVEDEYGIEIPDEVAENFTKVADIVEYIEANK